MTPPSRTRYYLYWAIHLLLIALGMLFLQSKSLAAQGIGTSIVAAGICGCVIFVYVLTSQRRGAAVEMLDDFGLVKIFQGRGVRIREAYDAQLKTATQRIDILGFGLRSFLEDYSHEFAHWTSRARVRVLLLDPEFPTSRHSYANQRDVEEKNDRDTIGADVRNFVTRSKPQLLTLGNQFEIRLYRCLPAINLFRIDGLLFWGPYLLGDQSRNMPTLVVREGGILYARFTRHFDDIWSNPTFSRDIPPEWLAP